ncbi:hypothetical protein BHUM_00242 [Candidatus Burkholderia humilis]|nr:hypothetical protein BHUM_00242 [Candidatus Burkholderia humilis]
MPRVRYDLVKPGGRYEPHWWLAINAPMFDAAGNVTAIIHQVTRVTELHFAEEVECEHQDRQTFLLMLSYGLQAEAQESAIAERAIHLLAEKLNLDRCYIATYLSGGRSLAYRGRDRPGGNATHPANGEARGHPVETDTHLRRHRGEPLPVGRRQDILRRDRRRRGAVRIR